VRRVVINCPDSDTDTDAAALAAAVVVRKFTTRQSRCSHTIRASPGVVEPNGVLRKFDSSYGTLQESHVQPKLSPEEIHLLRELNERDRQAFRGMPRPPAVDGLRALGYVVVHSPNSEEPAFQHHCSRARCTGDDRRGGVGSLPATEV
jgi:hypothetical protein